MQSVIYYISPTDTDLTDLDHYKYYTWGMKAPVFASPYERVVGAKLIIPQINNWTVEANDRLWITLLEDPKLYIAGNRNNFAVASDNQANGNWFTTNGNYYDSKLLLYQYTDTHETTISTRAQNPIYGFFEPIIVDFNETQLDELIKYLGTANGTFSNVYVNGNRMNNNATFGLGFDPDCHYYNTGMEFIITTAVPEPGTFALLGAGLLGLGFFGRRRMKR